MSTQPRLEVNKCLWIRSDLTDGQAIFRSIRSALLERGVTVLSVKGPGDQEGVERIRKAVWESDQHVILNGLLPGELKVLRPIFKERKNFSVALVDWWTSDYWFTINAEFVIFHNYSGIAVRKGMAPFIGQRKPPIFSRPLSTNRYHLQSSALRMFALAAAPLLDAWKRRQRSLEHIPAGRLLYFPFSLAEEHVPVKTEPLKFDFCNLSSTGGYWVLRDPHAPAWLTFSNLYYDRWRIKEMILKLPGRPFSLYDLGAAGRVNWEEYCTIARQSRFAISTGGLQQTSVAKYTEFACLGIPMLGEILPFEFPWLEKCLFQIDTLNVSPKELTPLLQEALRQREKLRQNCLEMRDSLLKLYNAHRVLDLLQEQVDGKPIPPGYLHPGVAS